MILWTILYLTAGLAAEIADMNLKKHLTTIPFPCAFAQGSLIITSKTPVVNSTPAHRVLNLQFVYETVSFCNFLRTDWFVLQ